MPARQLTDQLSVPRYAVIGAYAEGSAVRHVGLLTAQAQLSPGCLAEVYHMGPPLSLDAPHATMQAEAIGWIDALSEEQQLGMERWLYRVRTWLAGQPQHNQTGRARARDYIIYPPATPHADPAYRDSPVLIRDEQTGRMIYRFSCTGFVERCYAVGARILLIDHQKLPSTRLDELRKIWPDQVGQDDRIALRLLRAFGLDGAGPWPILLPGYLLHALARPDLSSPYQPVSADRSYPWPCSP